MRPCSDGCGKEVAHYKSECFPVAPWDPPGLPPRALQDRCSRHRNLCAYRDDDPLRCPRCHSSAHCTCSPPPTPKD